MGFGLQGRSVGRPPHFSFSAVAQAIQAAENVFFFRRPGLQPRRKGPKTNGLSRLLRPPIFGGSP
jgi:hypothetical protein